MYEPDDDNREYWLRGPIDGIPVPLQPVAHALRQAQKEINVAMKNFPEKLLWTSPAEVASVGFHLQHIRGVLHRLTTYALGGQLDLTQQDELKKEGKPYPKNESVADLLLLLNSRIDASIELMKNIRPESLAETAFVGRAKIASTKAGILFHAAEHTMRHTGQLLVTAKLLALNH